MGGVKPRSLLGPPKALTTHHVKMVVKMLKMKQWAISKTSDSDV